LLGKLKAMDEERKANKEKKRFSKDGKQTGRK
jgi:uncharacterized protein YkuJ